MNRTALKSTTEWPKFIYP